MTSPRESLFAVCAPGLEPVTRAELRGLGLEARLEPGGVAFPGSFVELYRASLALRTATRILLRLGEFRARTFTELERHARRLPWRRTLEPGTRFRLRVSCSKSRLYHEGAVAERLEAIVAGATGAAPERAPAGDDDADTQLLVVRLFRDNCTISADTSGIPLYMRGYRQAVARAPLRETLAAGMLLAAGWPANVPLLDPLCGSGTIAIEAALLARGIPPGLATAGQTPRRFRFEQWPGHDAAAFRDIVASLQATILGEAPAAVLASDRNAGAIRAARANAERAGVDGDIEFAVRPLGDVEPSLSAGWLVTNPPYGVRAGDRTESHEVGLRLARLAATSLGRWTLVLLAADDRIGHALGGEAREVLRTRNGGIAVRLLMRPPL